jgi:hypothetical protein
MPPLGSAVVDEEAVQLITAWIRSLPKRQTPLNVRLRNPRKPVTDQQVVTISGTARGDNLSRVIYTVNDGPEQLATGTASWSAEVVLDPGTNRIAVYAEDNNGRRSRPARKVLKFVER